MMNSNRDAFVSLLTSESPVTLLGASSVSARDIEEIFTIAPTLIAADGGADVAVAHGWTPTAVIGDFDSLAQSTSQSLPQEALFHVPEQDSTDFEKCLARVEAPILLALGFTGQRIDHELAVMNVLVRYPTKRCLVIGSDDVIFHAPRRLHLNLKEGSRLSLFPMAPVTGRSEGLRWPIEGIDFAPYGRVGTSNEVVGPVSLEFEGDGMLVIMPREGLADAMRAFGFG